MRTKIIKAAVKSFIRTGIYFLYLAVISGIGIASTLLAIAVNNLIGTFLTVLIIVFLVIFAVNLLGELE